MSNYNKSSWYSTVDFVNAKIYILLYKPSLVLLFTFTSQRKVLTLEFLLMIFTGWSPLTSAEGFF